MAIYAIRLTSGEETTVLASSIAEAAAKFAAHNRKTSAPVDRIELVVSVDLQ
jgi:hypothetical protein